MSMLSSLMSNVMSSARASRHSGSGSGSSSDPDKENRSAFRQLMANAVKPDSGYTKEQIAALIKNAPAGVDVSAYSTMRDLQSPEQQARAEVNKRVYSDFLQILNGGQPVQTPTSSEPTFTPSGAIQVNPPTPEKTTLPQKIFSKDFVIRKIIKDFSGIDVGGHYLEAEDWFKSYGEKVNSGVPVSKAVSDTATEYGFVPSGASNLKDLSTEEREVIFERELQHALNDPTVDAIMRKVTPEGKNVQKQKLGFILGSFAENGLYIPEHYQPFLDRWRGLEDPDYVSDELKTYVLQNTGVPLDMHSNVSGAIADARKAMQNDHFIQTQTDSYFRTIGKTKAERELELSKPISAEDRAKYGVGSKIKTYAQLADEGKRFATDADAKMYQELQTARERLIAMEPLLFGTQEDPKSGIFHDIGVSATARAAAKAKLMLEKVNGTQRGRNLEEYNDYMAYFARTLIKIAGESGSRLSDQDIQGIISVMSDAGRGMFGVPDSTKLAQSKYHRAVSDMARLMQTLESTTTVKPTGGATTPEYIIDKIYTDANGNKAKYVGGEKQWETVSTPQPQD